MRACLNCGYSNADEADTCLRCGYRLAHGPQPAPPVGPTPLAPLPFSRADTMLRVGRSVLLFLVGVGLCPVMLVVVSVLNPPYSSSATIIWGLLIAVLLLAVTLLIPKQTRPIGYGILAAAFIFPIVVAIACGVIRAA